MKQVSILRTFLFSAVLVMVFAGGCHHVHDDGSVSNSTGASKYDRLVGNKNLKLTTELENCRGQIEAQKKALADCQAEKEEIQKQASSTAEFLMNELPETMMDDNAKLKEEIAQLKEMLRQNSQSDGK